MSKSSPSQAEKDAKMMFSCIGTPVRKGNTIVPLVDGECAWQVVNKALKAATKSIYITMWMLSGNIELERPLQSHQYRTIAERQQFTFLSLLKEKVNDNVDIRILLYIPEVYYDYLEVWVWRFLRDSAIQWMALCDKIELLWDKSPVSPIHSWHQKSIVVDESIAFVGGMNMRENDWDTSSHHATDQRRNPHRMSATERLKQGLLNELPKFPPRHDLMTRIDGPLVQDVVANFKQRWNRSVKRFFPTKTFTIAILNQLATPTYFPSTKSLGNNSPTGSEVGQIARTMPSRWGTSLPSGEQGILSLFCNALSQAQHLIYIEDQYFRSFKIADELQVLLKKRKELKLIVIVPIGGFASRRLSIETMKKIRAARPNFKLHKLVMNYPQRKKKHKYVDVEIHAKMMIIDDKWYTIGSCNFNDRGLTHEGELNVASLNGAKAKQLRKQLMAEHLEISIDKVPDDMDEAVALFETSALENQKLYKANKPLINRLIPYDYDDVVAICPMPAWVM